MSGENSLLEMVRTGQQEAPSQPAYNEESSDAERRLHPRDLNTYQAFSSVSKRTAPEQFELFSSRGNSRLVEYHTLLGSDYHPSHGILLTCVAQKVLIEGKQLERLVRELQNHRVQWIAEFDGKQKQTPGEKAVVTSIRVYSVGQDNVMGLDEAIAAEIREFDTEVDG